MLYLSSRASLLAIFLPRKLPNFLAGIFNTFISLSFTLYIVSVAELTPDLGPLIEMT